jgi:hypothetical protein
MKLLLTILLLLFAAVPVIEHNRKRMSLEVYLRAYYIVYAGIIADLICIIWIY